MADSECPQAESGKHEPDYERLSYEKHVDGNSAQVAVECIHCGQRGETMLYDSDFDWID